MVHTARPWSDYEAIQKALNAVGWGHLRIVCGKLLAMAYIDDRAINASEESWLP